MFSWLSNLDINNLRFRGSAAQNEEDVCNQAKEANNLRDILDSLGAIGVDGTLPVKRGDKDAILPTRGSEHAAGLDLYSVIDHSISPGKYTGIPTDISVAIPEGNVGLIWPRSGLAAAFGIDILAGVIDSDYRGEIVVLLGNRGNVKFHINKGDRIAQLVVQPITRLLPREVPELPETQRGKDGLGSTGR